MSYYVHVIGPDDVHKCETLLDALRLQADYTQSALKLAEQGSEYMPAVWANILSEEDHCAMRADSLVTRFPGQTLEGYEERKAEEVARLAGQAVGWYSERQAEFGTSFWRHEDGSEVEVTTVIRDGSAPKWLDAVNLGPVIHYARAGRDRRKIGGFSSVRPLGLSFDAIRPVCLSDKDREELAKILEVLKGGTP